MTDLDLIRELRPDEPLAAARELAPARRRLTDAIEAEMGWPRTAARAAHSIYPQLTSATPPVPVTSVRSRRRLALAAVALTAAAAGVAAVLLTVPGSRGTRPTPPSGASAPAVPSASAGHASHPGHPGHPGPAHAVRPFTGRLTAARFLNAAARAALAQPARPPRPGQFVYAETEGPGGSSRYQIWQSADGSQPGLVINGQGAFPLAPCTVARAPVTHCAATAGYLPGLPVRPRAVLAYLTRIGLADAADLPGGSSLHKSIPHWIANDLGKTLAVLLSDTYLKPAQRAALYEFMARTPGFTVAAHVADATGRPGVGIAWTYQGVRSLIIFSRQDYAYLGERTVAPGQIVGSSALIKFAIVNSLPPHATPTPPVKAKLKGRPRHHSGSSPSPQA